MQRSRYVTSCTTALRRIRWLQSMDDILDEGGPEKLNRLYEVLKRLVDVKVLDRLGPGAMKR